VLLAANDYRYWNVRLLWKAGIFLDYSPLKAGLAITTPSVNLFGDGSTTFNVFTLGVDTDGSGIDDVEMAANYQDGLPTTYKSPVSLALGVSYVLGATSLFTTVESFGGISRYDVIETEPFAAQGSGDTVATRYTAAARAVTNWGFGVEHRVGTGTRLYGGFITDRSAQVPDPDNLLIALSNWDVYHVALGGTFTVSTLEFTVGGNYSWGDDMIEQLGDVTDPGSPVDSGIEEREVRYSRFRLILGVTAGI
jgi:hypothetical protein